MSTDTNAHWEAVYKAKAPDAVSWHRPHLEKSLALIGRVAPDRSAPIIDVGGGESTLVDDLLTIGYRDITVLDISATAIEVARRRLGDLATKVTWLTGDITNMRLPSHRYDIWHDRAVFHFLTTPEARAAYIERVSASVKPGGYVIVATFGPEGPTQCSGLDILRYSAESLHAEFGAPFHLMGSLTELHRTPFDTEQQFLYCLCRRQSAPPG